MTYCWHSQVPKMAAELTEHNFQLVICDESHSIKDPKARRPSQLMTS